MCYTFLRPSLSHGRIMRHRELHFVLTLSARRISSERRQIFPGVPHLMVGLTPLHRARSQSMPIGYIKTARETCVPISVSLNWRRSITHLGRHHWCEGTGASKLLRWRKHALMAVCHSTCLIAHHRTKRWATRTSSTASLAPSPAALCSTSVSLSSAKNRGVLVLLLLHWCLEW
jgi:hypothetical protein